jgi:hypothetical protein
MISCRLRSRKKVTLSDGTDLLIVWPKFWLNFVPLFQNLGDLKKWGENALPDLRHPSRDKIKLFLIDLQFTLAKCIRHVRPKMVDFVSGQGLSVFAIAGIAARLRGMHIPGFILKPGI